LGGATLNGKIYYGWWVVFGASFILFVCLGIGFPTFPVFLKFIEADTGWGRGSLSNAGAFLAVAAGFTSPAIGYAMDRFSARVVMLPGAILLSASFLLLGSIGSVGQLYLLFVTIGIGMSATTMIPTQTLVSRWFDQKRGRAMGVIAAAGGLGGVIWMPVAARLIESVGWRDAYEILGIIIAVVSLPFIWLFIRTSPQSMGLAIEEQSNTENARPAPEPGTSPGDEGVTGYEVSRAIRMNSFRLIACAVFMVAIAASGFGLHVVAFFSDSGFSPTGAALVWSLTMGVSIGGRFFFGYASEKYQKRYFAAAANLSRSLSLGVLVLFSLEIVPLSVAVVQLIIIYGLAAGCNNVLNPLIMSETFGVKSFGKLMGMIGIPFTLGMAIGQVAGGHLFESMGNYNIAFGIFAVAFVFAGIAIGLARPNFLLDTD
jgi:MFS family permease